jgi:hypothetical protein
MVEAAPEMMLDFMLGTSRVGDESSDRKAFDRLEPFRQLFTIADDAEGKGSPVRCGGNAVHISDFGHPLRRTSSIVSPPVYVDNTR